MPPAMTDSSSGCGKTANNLVHSLRPGFLDCFGIVAAIEIEANEFTKRTGIPCKIIKASDNIDVSDEQSITLFRVFQETLTNIARHSGATKVVVILREDGRNLSGDENLVLEIRDNGRGIKEEEILNPKSLGLVGMKERTLTFGGEFSIFGEPGGGTAVSIKIPRKLGGRNDQSYNS